MENEFRKLVDELYRPVLNFFARKGVAQEQRADLAQETFLRAYRGYEHFRGDAKIRTWVFRIARNVWNNSVRDQHAAKREGQEVSLDGVAEADQQIPQNRVFTIEGGKEDPLGELLDQERKQLLEAALDSLPLQMKYCVLLRLQDLKYREIAAIQKISIETVKAHLFQARKRLKEALGEYFEIHLGNDHD
jgi:RNA polymerase sigma-70 factor (ECF subfamily)